MVSFGVSSSASSALVKSLAFNFSGITLSINPKLYVENPVAFSDTVFPLAWAPIVIIDAKFELILPFMSMFLTKEPSLLGLTPNVLILANSPVDCGFENL